MLRLMIALSALCLAACGIPQTMEAVRETPEKMNQMQGELTKTSEAIRLQKVSIALENLEKEENARVLSPVPFGLMPWAKVYAENATVDELVKLTYLWIKQVNEEVLTANIDASGNEVPFTASETAAHNHRKMHRVLALQAIAGQIPEITVDAIIASHIRGDSRFRDTAFSLLMMRVQFLRDVFLEASLLGEQLNNVGKVEDAVMYTQQMDRILKLSFVDRLNVRFTGFLAPMETFEESLNKESAKALAIRGWSRLQSKVQEQMVVEEQSTSSDPALTQERQRRAQKAQERIQASLTAWENTRP